jgi:hypothetical protein
MRVCVGACIFRNHYSRRILNINIPIITNRIAPEISNKVHLDRERAEEDKLPYILVGAKFSPRIRTDSERTPNPIWSSSRTAKAS